MQKRTLGILFMAIAVPSIAHAEVQWGGGAGIRRVIRKIDDGLGTTDAANNSTSKSTNQRYEYRGIITAASKSDNLDWGIDVRTQPAGTITTEWVSNTTSADLGVNLGQAYGRYHRSFEGCDLGLTFGRARTVLLYENVTQELFDNDIRWDGFGWTFKHGMFGLNAVQYVLGAVNQGTVGASTFSRTDASDSNSETQSHFGMLYSFQPYVEFKIAEEITSKFAIGWLNWAGTGGATVPGAGTGFFTNNVHGGTANSTAGVAVGNVNPVVMDNAQQWQLFSETMLPFNLRFAAEYIRNKKTFYGTRQNVSNPAVEANRSAFAATLAWGKGAKAGDYLVQYSYGNKGIASVVNTFTQGDVAADNISHFFEGRYYYADNINFVAKAQFHSEKAQLGGDGQPLAAPNAGRKQKQSRYELVTNLAF